MPVDHLAHLYGDGRNGEHRTRLREAENHIVSVEAIAVQRVEDPGSRNNEEHDEPGERRRARVPGERCRELADRGGENEVEEQVKPCRVPLSCESSRVRKRGGSSRNVRPAPT
jgi:hypothetical protein